MNYTSIYNYNNTNIENYKDTSKQKVNLIYWVCKKGHGNGNFGDELSKFITESLINTDKYELVYNSKDVDINFNLICIGSYIQNALNNSYIYGSGMLGLPKIIKVNHNYKKLNVCAVRGPLTKKFLEEEKGIMVGNILGDPALLLPKFYKPTIIPSLHNKIGIVPHLTKYKNYADNIDTSIYHLISPTDKWENVINTICSCKAVISSSLHGLICSDTYNIPNVWLDETNPGYDFKYYDYFDSQNRPHTKISNVSEFKEDLLYKDGNKINLAQLMDAFPFK